MIAVKILVIDSRPNSVSPVHEVGGSVLLSPNEEQPRTSLVTSIAATTQPGTSEPATRLAANDSRSLRRPLDTADSLLVLCGMEGTRPRGAAWPMSSIVDGMRCRIKCGAGRSHADQARIPVHRCAAPADLG